MAFCIGIIRSFGFSLVIIAGAERLHYEDSSEDGTVVMGDSGRHNSEAQDFALEEMVNVLNPDTSYYWAQVADTIRAHHVRKGRPSKGGLSLIESKVGMLNQEHHLLQRLFGKIRNSNESGLDTCTGNPLVGEDSDGDLSDRNASGKNVSVAPAASPVRNPRLESFYVALEKFKLDLAMAVENLRNVTNQFVYTVLRWSISARFYPPDLLHYPALGFQCTPLRACVRGFLMVPRALFKVLLEVGKGMVRMFKSLKDVIAYEGGEEEKAQDIAENDADEEDNAIAVPLDVNDTDVNANQEAFFEGNEEVVSKECLRLIRLEGSFALRLSGIPVMKLKFSTIALPGNRWHKHIMRCWKKIIRQFRKAFQNKNEDMEQHMEYFGPERCNPHTVGLCMLLEKTQQCGISMETGGVMMSDPNMTSGAASSFCSFFSGMKLAMTRADGKLWCAKAWQRHLENVTRENVSLESDKITAFDLEFGCQDVVSRMKLVRACPANTSKAAFLQCRQLFGCTHQKPVEPRLLRWEDYASAIMARVSNRIQLAHNPQASQEVSEIVRSVDARGQAFQSLVDESTDDGEQVQSAELDPARLFSHPLWSDDCFENLEGDTPWASNDARKRLHDWKVKRFGQSERHKFRELRAGFYRVHTRQNLKQKEEGFEAQGFFWRMSEAMHLDRFENWQNSDNETSTVGDAHWCETAPFVESQPPPPRKSRVQGYDVTQFMVHGSNRMDSAGKWGIRFGEETKEVHFETPGWVGNPTRLTIEKKQGSFGWTLQHCDGSLCGSVKDGQDLRSLRITVSTDEHADVASVCQRTVQMIGTLGMVRGASLPGEENFMRVADILERNADQMDLNLKGFRNHSIEQKPVDWMDLAEILGQTSFLTARDLVLQDDPFERFGWQQDDEQFHELQHKEGEKNKLADFLRSRGWQLVRSTKPEKTRATLGALEFHHRDAQGTPTQLRNLAVVLRNPREGLVFAAALALFDFTVDLLNGMPQRVIYFKDTELDNIENAILDLPPPGDCNVILVSVEFEERVF